MAECYWPQAVSSGTRGRGRPRRRWAARCATLQVMVLVFLVAAAGIVLVVLAALRNRRERR
jgi:hypothetical protein